jgi:hypothetical protein
MSRHGRAWRERHSITPIFFLRTSSSAEFQRSARPCSPFRLTIAGEIATPVIGRLGVLVCSLQQQREIEHCIGVIRRDTRSVEPYIGQANIGQPFPDLVHSTNDFLQSNAVRKQLCDLTRTCQIAKLFRSLVGCVRSPTLKSSLFSACRATTATIV